MKTHLYTAGRIACGEIPEHSPMIRDPTRNDRDKIAAIRRLMDEASTKIE